MKKLFSIFITTTISLFTLAFFGANVITVEKNTNENNVVESYVTGDDILNSSTTTQNVSDLDSDPSDLDTYENDDSFTVTWTVDTTPAISSMKFKVYDNTNKTWAMTSWVDITAQSGIGALSITDSYFDVKYEHSYKVYFQINGVEQTVVSDSVYIYSEPSTNEYLGNVEVKSIGGSGNDDIYITYTLYKTLPAAATMKVLVESQETESHNETRTYTNQSRDADGKLMFSQGVHSFNILDVYKFDDYIVYFSIDLDGSGANASYVTQLDHSRTFNVYGETVGYDNDGLSWWVWLLISLMAVTLAAFVWWGVDVYRKKKLLPEIANEVKQVDSKPEEMIVKSNEWLENIKKQEEASNKENTNLENKQEDNNESK